jgi:DNA-binding XRE family transcriptional regulator
MLLGKTVPPEVLKRMRVNAGYNQTELAEMLGVSKRTIVSREQKECNVSFSEFEKMIMICSSTPEERAANKKFLKTIKDAFSGLVSRVKAN